MSQFKIGDKVRGRFWKFAVGGDVVWINFEGVIVDDFEDDSYEVATVSGHNILVELSDENKMELIQN